jgi:hypothetical protein
MSNTSSAKSVVRQFLERGASEGLDGLPLSAIAGKEAMDFSSIAPVLKPERTMDAREIARALRQAIAAEHDAVHLYELIADSCDNKVVKELLQDIADEEKVHVGEIQWLLSQIDRDNGKLLLEGMEEAQEVSE